MKKIILVLVILIIIVMKTECWATEEVSLNETFNSLYNLINDNNQEENHNPYIAINKVFYILKKYPESLEAFYTLTLFDKINDLDIVARKIKNIPEDCNIDSCPVNILVNSMIILRFDSDEVDNVSLERLKKYLIALSQGTNKYYAALASIILMKDSPIRKNEYDKFKEKFPDSAGIPIVDLFIATQYYNDRQYEKCIQETNKLIEKYKEIVSPFGWKLVMDYYCLVIHCYIQMNDTANAEKYYELMANEAPNYYYLHQIKMSLRAKK
ncbi:MAG: hypothetical protein QMC67_15615 [Candidatus Wallbacteria bacterium]